MMEEIADNEPGEDGLREVIIVGKKVVSKAGLEGHTGIVWTVGPSMGGKTYWCKFLEPDQLQDTRANLDAFGIRYTLCFSSTKPSTARIIVPKDNSQAVDSGSTRAL